MFITSKVMLRYTYLAPTVYALLLLCLLLPLNATAAATSYSIVLASAPGKNLEWTPKKSPLFNGRTFYTEQTLVKGSPWERLCLGFYSDRKQAAAKLKEIRKLYPGAWIQKTSAKNIASTLKPPAPARPSAASASPPVSVPGSLTEAQLDSLMKRARQDIRTKQYNSAIRYLTALVSAGDHKYSREALELLGQARQRNGQYAHAVNTYEKYLALYPDGKDSDRVRQRLVGLKTAAKGPMEEIRMETDEVNEFTSYGTLAQFYRNNTAEIEGSGKITNLSQLITFVDATALQRTEKFDHKLLFAGDLTNDFIDSDDGNEMRFIQTYYELSYRKTGTSGRFGRQQILLGGVIKRFDGLSAGYQFTPEMRLNVIGGLPVDITDNKSSLNDHKTFYGFTFETGTFLEHWDMNLFYFDQQVDGLTDQNSVGTEVRYLDRRKSMIAMIDYDVFYKELNIVQLNTNILFDAGSSLFLNYFMRNVPPLATSNALIGRQESTIEELKEVLDVEEIYQLATDRTAVSQNLTVGGTQPLSERFKATADISFIKVSDTVASGGVLATSGTGTDYILSAQLVGNDLMVKRDTNIFGLRYYGTVQSDTTALFINSRFPLTKSWWINPRLQYDIRRFADGLSQTKLRATLKTYYRYLNKARFDFEVGYFESIENTSGQSRDINNIFFALGYRWDF